MNNRTEIPDLWVIIRLESEEFGVHHRVVGSWYGGYGGNDSYQFSSGIMGCEPCMSFYKLPQHSGSIYHCGYTQYGTSGWTRSVLDRYIREAPPELLKITLLTETEAVSYLKDLMNL